MLMHHLKHEDIMHKWNKRQYDEEEVIPNAAWLFLSRGADKRAMYPNHVMCLETYTRYTKMVGCVIVHLRNFVEEHMIV